MFYFVPRKLRAKLNQRWKIGIYLGQAPTSNESYVGTWCGDVVRARGLLRVVEGSRWSLEAANRVTGTPMRPNPSGNKAYESVEASENPSGNLDDVDLNDALDDPKLQEAMAKRVRITQADLVEVWIH